MWIRATAIARLRRKRPRVRPVRIHRPDPQIRIVGLNLKGHPLSIRRKNRYARSHDRVVKQWPGLPSARRRNPDLADIYHAREGQRFTVPRHRDARRNRLLRATKLYRLLD
jgi:hypothetical protein